MVAAPETNVLVPSCAREALDRLAAARDESRSAAVRRLLDAYAERQSAIPPDDRLVHVSTVLRYPLRRRRHLGRPLPNDDVEVVPVRIRGVGSAAIEHVRELAFRLPGQPPRRGHGDYQARTLTDAVMTAIATEERFEDAFLLGLMPLLRQGAARELWHAVVQLTLTRAERVALEERDLGFVSARTAELLDADEAWHHDQRLVVLRRFARGALSGPDARANEAALHAGRMPGGEIEELAEDLREARDNYAHSLTGAVGADWHPVGREGRGGTAIWRASHAAALEQVPGWLAGTSTEPLRIAPVGGFDPWQLRVPESWTAAVHRKGRRLPEVWRTAVTERRLIELRPPAGAAPVLWPLLPGSQLVPRLGLALRDAGRLSSEQLVELLLMEPLGPVWPTVSQAVAWGLIYRHQLPALRVAARNESLRLMRETADRAERDGVGGGAVAELRGALFSPPEFARFCRRHGVEYEPRHSNRVPWVAPSLADAIGDAAVPDEALRWLGGERVRSRRERLRMSEHEAWRAAIARYRHDTRARQRAG